MEKCHLSARRPDGGSGHGSVDGRMNTGTATHRVLPSLEEEVASDTGYSAGRLEIILWIEVIQSQKDTSRKTPLMRDPRSRLIRRDRRWAGGVGLGEAGGGWCLMDTEFLL